MKAVALQCGGATAFPYVGTGPIFRSSGPDADRYGAGFGFPVRRPIEEPTHRVGAFRFSHLGDLYPTRVTARAPTTWSFRVRHTDIVYSHGGVLFSAEEHLARNPVIGHLIVRGDDSVFEAYQYGRTNHDWMMSQSIAKSLIGPLVGIADSDGAIHSVDDPAELYVDEFNGTKYGKTAIRDLLHILLVLNSEKMRKTGAILTVFF